MNIKIIYSHQQLESAIKYISKNNKFFKNKDNEIRESIMKSINQLATTPTWTNFGTMGYLVVQDQQLDDLDNDENVCYVEIFVKPDLNISPHIIDDLIETEVIVSAKKFYE